MKPNANSELSMKVVRRIKGRLHSGKGIEDIMGSFPSAAVTLIICKPRDALGPFNIGGVYFSKSAAEREWQGKVAGNEVGAIWDKVNLRRLVSDGLSYPHSNDYMVAPGQGAEVYRLLAESLRK